MEHSHAFPPEAAIRIIWPKVDPLTKESKSRPYAEFYAHELGVDTIEGENVAYAAPVRLPDDIEPGAVLDLYVAFNGSVCATVSDKGITNLFDPLQVIVTDMMTVQRWQPK